MFHMQLSKLVGVAQAAKKDGSLAAGKPSAKTMSMLERCEKPALWYRMERLKRHGLALAAGQQDGMALKLQNKLIRRDRGIVLAAVKQNGMALQFADPDHQENLNRDREIVMTAVGSNGLDALIPLFSEMRQIRTRLAGWAVAVWAGGKAGWQPSGWVREPGRLQILLLFVLM